MKRKIITTADGSKTIYLPEWEEHYHSKHGAIQEAYHVFIKHGLKHFYHSIRPSKVSILEIGFGTGLNAIITLIESEKIDLKVEYHGIEAYPIEKHEIAALNYTEELSAMDHQEPFLKMHEVSWEQLKDITSNFSLIKRNQFFLDINDKEQHHLIYFDAFGARVQPELWTETIFQKMYEALKPRGVLVTYAAKGSVRRAMQAVGFAVERLPGPPGKREMLRATKTGAQHSETPKK